MNRGLLHMQQTKDHRRAIASYDAVLRLRPDFAPALGLRAVAHYQLQEHAEAEQDAVRALQLDPDDTNASQVLERIRAE
jgi:tetratricopeptide (TPR) repeat protein